MKKENMLDEMQEKKLMQIESTGFWIAFAGLLAAIVIQALVHPDLRQIAGELAVFFIMSIYLIILCLKNGLWSTTPAPTVKGNAISSAAAALAIGLILIVRSQLILRNGFSKEFAGLLSFSMAVVFGGCFATLEVTRAIYQRRRSKLDHPNGESEES